MYSKKLLIAVFILLYTAACPSTYLAPIGKDGSFVPEEDEKRLWNRSKEEQRRIARSGQLYEDAELNRYLNSVARKLLPENLKDDISVKVIIIKNPLLNAFAYPNGVIYVHTGILAKMENEDQLAALLGHEMTHVINRHGARNSRSVKNKSATFAGLQVAAIPFGVYGDIVSILGNLGAMAAVTGYSRDLEREADILGYSMMVNAGYDPYEAPKLFEHLKRDIEEQDIKEPFFFGSHPRLEERINSYHQLLEERNAEQVDVKKTDHFEEILARLVLDNAELDLCMGRFTSAEVGIRRSLKKDPENAKAHYCLGELYRERNCEGDKQAAEKAYIKATACDPKYPDPHKQLGIFYYKMGMKNKAITELVKYLKLSPHALDRKYIEQYIKEIETRVTGTSE